MGSPAVAAGCESADGDMIFFLSRNSTITCRYDPTESAYGRIIYDYTHAMESTSCQAASYRTSAGGVAGKQGRSTLIGEKLERRQETGIKTAS